MIFDRDNFRTLLPQKFLASGINCGIRRYRPDLGIIISELPSVAVGVFTKNVCKAAPVSYSQAILPAINVRGVITNTGQANAATGAIGKQYNQQMVECLAKHLGCQEQQILAASTGVIGEQIEIDKIVKGIPMLMHQLTSTADKFAISILTTDLVPKVTYKEVRLSCGTVHMTGICKGSGMIHPNMGTMLAYILTDVKLDPSLAQQMLDSCVDDSFNMISVDGETSTNDSVFLLANGASNIELLTQRDQQVFQQALLDMSVNLAKRIASDGEGASKLLEVKVTRAPSVAKAKSLARSLTVSPLIKSAIHGNSPNWGRVISRLGQEQLENEILEKCAVIFQGHKVFSEGLAQTVDKSRLKTDMKRDTVTIIVDLAQGDYEAIAWGCDLSSKYVTINAEYVT